MSNILASIDIGDFKEYTVTILYLFQIFLMRRIKVKYYLSVSAVLIILWVWCYYPNNPIDRNGADRELRVVLESNQFVADLLICFSKSSKCSDEA